MIPAEGVQALYEFGDHLEALLWSGENLIEAIPLALRRLARDNESAFLRMVGMERAHCQHRLEMGCPSGELDVTCLDNWEVLFQWSEPWPYEYPDDGPVADDDVRIVPYEYSVMYPIDENWKPVVGQALIVDSFAEPIALEKDQTVVITTTITTE